MHDKRILKIPPFRASTRRAFRKEGSTTRAGFFIFSMEHEDRILGIYAEQIEAYKEMYNIERIRSASEAELWGVISRMEKIVEERKITQHELTEYTANPEKYWDKSKILKFQHEKQLKAINEIILHLETMLKFAKIEQRKYTNKRFSETLNNLATVLQRLNSQTPKKSPEIKTKTEKIKPLPEKNSIQKELSNNPKEATRFTQKHKIIKKGVDELHSSLKSERPETTLEETKRIYADLTKDSYENVNKAYHYKGKK